MCAADLVLNILNRRAELDFFTSYNVIYQDNMVNDDPYFGVNLHSQYHDIKSLSKLHESQKRPIILSINIQSLQSKYEQLCIEINELLSKKVEIDAIVLQETWNILHPELLNIKGFKPLLYRNRRGMRGGGVGFYIKDTLSACILKNLSPFENKIMESITIQLSYPGKSRDILLTSVYRSNGPIPNVTPSQQMEQFMNIFASLLSDLKRRNLHSFVFTDSNINLLQLESSDASNFMNCLFANGYLQCISKPRDFKMTMPRLSIKFSRAHVSLKSTLARLLVM
jgi:hypothetical protein